MAFPKPETRTPKTNVAYERRYAQLADQTARQIGAQNRDCVSPTQVASYVIGRKSGLSKKTWQVYKSALLAHFEQVAAASKDFYMRLDCTHATGLLRQESQTGALTRGTRTSSLKSRRISEEDHRQLIEYLGSRKSKDKWAAFTLTWCQAARVTGLRPCEWARACVDQLPDGEPVLVITNAKQTQGRGNGAVRHLVLSGLSSEQLGHIEDMGEIARYYESTEETMDDVQKCISKYLSRAIKAALGRRRQYPCMYTFRHQFAADAKRWLSPAEVAALMGHCSDQTASRNYARAGAATRSAMVRPIAAEVATVKRVARPRPYQRRERYSP